MNACEILIIGAGPTGLAAALAGIRQGLRVRIVDKIATRSDKSRALVVHARTLEFFQKLGIATEFVKRGTQTVEGVLSVEGKKLGGGTLGPVAKEETPFPYALFMSQAETEGILEAALQQENVAVEYQTSFEGLKQDADGVTVMLRSPAGTETVRCLYLVGGDGAHSAVRHALGVAFSGAPYPQDFLLCDAHILAKFEPLKLNLFLGKHGVLALFPLEGKSLTRAILAQPKGASGAAEPSVSECEAAIADYLGSPVKLDDVRWIARFRLHHRIAARFAVGRVFLAGDAAHIHSPAGGQGMNTGIQDAWNLMWKIAAVVRDHAHPALLETYHAERYRVGLFLLKRTDRLFQLAATRRPLLTRLRNALFPFAFKLGSFFPHRVGVTLFRLVSQIGIRYRLSPLSVERRSRVPSKAPRAGWRAPDVPLKSAQDDTSLFELTRGPSFHALVYGRHFDASDQARWDNFAAAQPFPLKVILIAATLQSAGFIDHTGAFAHRFGVEGEAVFLLRPDGYIALATDDFEESQVAAYLDGLKRGILPPLEN